MNAKSIYDKLVNVEEVPSSILTYSDKGDCIFIEIQDYDKSVFKFAQKFFNGYKGVDVYYNEYKTIVWYNEVSVYSDRETVETITSFYYDMKVKGLVESKKSSSIKESKDIEIKVYFDGHTTPSNKYQDYNFSPYSRKYEISGLTEFKDDVTLTFERGKVKSLTYLGVTVDFDKKNNAKCDNWECEIDIDEIQEYIIKFSLRLFI